MKKLVRMFFISLILVLMSAIPLYANAYNPHGAEVFKGIIFSSVIIFLIMLVFMFLGIEGLPKNKKTKVAVIIFCSLLIIFLLFLLKKALSMTEMV